eukprot:113405_1
MSQYNQLTTDEIESKQNNNLIQNKSDIIAPLKVQDDMDTNPTKPTKSSKSKHKSKKSKKSKSKSSRKLRARDNEDHHSLNAFTSSSKYSSKYTSLDERPFNPKRAHTTHNCLTKTAPFNAGHKHNLQLNADLIQDNIPQSHDQHDPRHHEDASNLAFPVNPFDHLMPHKDDFGTPNMAWIGDDGLVHTPQGGVYAKTTEAIANFRRELKYDSGWHRTRQRYICLILLIMFLTVCAVVVLLIARDVRIVDINIIHGSETNVFHMDNSCKINETVSQGCNVTIRPILDIKINNKNWVPATINKWNVKHTFFCARTLNCPSGGTEFGTDPMINDGSSEVARKDTGTVVLNDTEIFTLAGCKMNPPNGTYCEWEKSCIDTGDGDTPGHFVLSMKILVELSFALQSSTEISSTVRLGTSCNGTAIVCQVDEVVKSNAKLC